MNHPEDKMNRPEDKMDHREKFHAKTLKGLEHLLADELQSLGAEKTEVLNRGVDFYGGRAMMYRVNVASRLTLRVLLPVLQFRAEDPDTLYKKVKGYDWSIHLDNKMTFAIDPVVYSPVFRNSQYVAMKVKDAIADRFREHTGLRPSVNREHPDLLINVHISDRRVTVSLDSSGDSLHRRGYRTGTFEAPLNEVLAAGMVLATGWKGDRPFIDPMCGSGTIAIEAALIAAGIPPGIFRNRYGFENWKDFDRDLMERVAEKLPREKKVTVPIIAWDNNPEAVRLAREQIRRMELDHLVEVEEKDFAGSSGPSGGATIVMNPPYGERMDPGNIDTFYRMIGTTLKHSFPGSDAWVLSSSRKALRQIGLKPEKKMVLYNGSLECLYVNFKTFTGTWKQHKTPGTGG